MAKQKNVIPACVPTAPLVKGGIYVGVDQSLTGTGLVILDQEAKLLHQDCLETKPGQTPLEECNRYISLFRRVYSAVMTASMGAPVALVMEDFAYAQAHQMAALGGLGWHFRIMLSQTGWHYATCSTNNLKKMATGKGTCEKEQVMLGVYKRWTFEASDNNVADAYVLARAALTAYAKPTLGTLGVRKDDLEVAQKLTIYR